MKALSDLKMFYKLLLGFGISVLFLIIIAVLGYQDIKTIQESLDATYNDRLIPLVYLNTTGEDLYKIRGDVFKTLVYPNQRQDIEKDIRDAFQTIEQQLALYKQTKLTKEEEEKLANFENAYNEYKQNVLENLQLLSRGDDATVKQSLNTGGRTANSRQAVDKAIQELVDLNRKLAEEMHNQATQSYHNALRLFIIISVLAVLFSIFMAFVLANNITAPMSIILKALKDLTIGDLLRDLDDKTKDIIRRRNDELGEVGKSLDHLIDYLQEMGTVIEQIARNDLTASITPKSEKDILGKSLVLMIKQLTEQISKIAETSHNVSSASAQLAAASNQSGTATTQIATTVQQVAKGAQQQTEAITHSAHAMEEMSRAIDGVARGSQEQAAAIATVSQINSQLTIAIQQVTENAQSISKEAFTASQSAAEGAKAVEATVEGMQRIKERVGMSAARVQDMTSRSEEIGNIVLTIEDVAAQTNLLALNAAIEAARAGEHGKGFAVVADEVRRLAERASAATKEIGSLIKEVQTSIAEAMGAMKESEKEVLTGTELAHKAGKTLEEILSINEKLAQRAEQSAAAAEEMSAASSELSKAVDAVSAVIEENTAAAEEMAASSKKVRNAIESVASVSEENSAAAEEVSAAVEEMSAQVEEVAASAQNLNESTNTLNNIVALFKLA